MRLTLTLTLTLALALTLTLTLTLTVTLGDPDDLHTLQLLVGEGVTFVNSDLPRSFLEGRGAAPSVAE